ncbi:hypothetical protein QEN58_06045 [Halomonas alkaliantarctica]|uniref:Uncharacterized protein n=1 Tax=Halomonas alkaliantarctica TaxID=232346 RepID=A0ABY8LT82_9GAMM|nr:hypothetical protein [Halomonas alkaliantarctica]WGI26619.1 hypothetical protein QEN58_06045 [Halomonas alkaliantarctica]
MTIEVSAIITLLVMVVTLAALRDNRHCPDAILGCLPGHQPPAKRGVITFATLYVVAVGLYEIGAIQWLAHRLYGQTTRLSQAQPQLHV